MKRVALLACVALVLLAGCAGDDSSPTPEATPTFEEGQNPSPTLTSDPSVDQTQTSAPTATDAPTPTHTPTDTPTPIPPDNPWGTHTVSVTFNDRTDSDRDLAPLVRDAVEYWNPRVAEHTEYNVSFSFEPDLSAQEADLIIVATEPISHCGGPVGLEEVFGCYRHEHRADVYVNQTNHEFYLTTAHEIGHALGLGHDDTPRWAMASADSTQTGSHTNAIDRENPWGELETIRFTVGDSIDDHDEMMAELESVAEFYGDNEQYVPEGMDVEVVESHHEANVIVKDSSETAHEFDGPASIGYPTRGRDYDADDDFEMFTSAEMYLHRIPPREADEHMGYWIGRYLGNDDSEMPSRYR